MKSPEDARPKKKARRSTPMADRAARVGIELDAVPELTAESSKEEKAARRKMQVADQKRVERAEQQHGVQQTGGGGSNGDVSESNSDAGESVEDT